MIQKPKIKFTIADTIYIKNNSPNALFFPTESQSQNLDIVWGQNRAVCGSPEQGTIT